MIEDFVRHSLATIPSAWGDGNCRGHIDVAQFLIKEIKPQITVDLGVDYGYSLISLAYKNPGMVFGIDCFEGDEWTGIRNTYQYVNQKIHELNFNNVKLVKGYFDDVVQTWYLPIDILHIDGFHSYEAVKNDFEKWSHYVKKNGVIMFHDTNSHDTRFGVKQFFNELDLHKIEFLNHQGLGIVSKNQQIIEQLKIFKYD